MNKFREQVMKPSWLNFSEFNSPQQQGVERPELMKPLLETDKVIKLPEYSFDCLDVYSTIKQRRSIRKFADAPMSLDVLSFLCYSTLGVREEDHRLRMSPSAGARQAIETYIYAYNIEGLTRGLYRYYPATHVLIYVHNQELGDYDIKGFRFNAPCVFMWTAVPYRMEWRYAHCAEKLILLDAGHVCQNLYLAGESIGYGVCAVGAYDQNKVDKFLQVDGEDEFMIYAAPVGLK
jgi:SagB-type dehydrogenase family enzyme